MPSMVREVAFSMAMLMTSVPAYAETAVLTRSEAVDLAVTRSAELGQLRSTSELARQLSRTGPYPFNPIFSAELEGTSSPFSSREYVRRLAVEQELDLRGERSARRKVGSAASALASHVSAARQDEIAASVDEVVGRWLIAEERRALLAELTQHSTSVQASVEAARRRETTTGFSVRLLRADLVALQGERVEAELERDQAAAEIRTWLGLSESDSVRFSDDLQDSAWHCPPESILALARQTRSDLKRAAAAESLATRRLELERRLGRINPTIGVSAARERTDLGNFPLTGGGSVGPIEDTDTVIGLRASVPLPLSQRNQVAIGEATLDEQRARSERLALDLIVTQEALSACAALDRAEERRSLLAGVVQGAASDLELTEDAYRGGRIPLEDYLTLRERLLRVRRDLVDAIAAVENARTRLVRATGLRRETLAARFQSREHR